MTTFIMPMAYLEEGQKAKIVRVELEENKRKRMMDLGLAAGTQVVCAGKAGRGGPTAYYIKGTVFAFREEDCKRIIIAYKRADLFKEVCV